MAKPIDAVMRPKGLGLGADKSTVLQAAGGVKTDGQETGGDKAEALDMKRGTYCVVEGGKYEGLYGQVSQRGT